MKFTWHQLIRHVASRKTYIVVGLPSVYRLASTEKPAYAYMDRPLPGDPSHVWLMSQDEVEDGRFEAA